MFMVKHSYWAWAACGLYSGGNNLAPHYTNICFRNFVEL